MTSQRLKRKRSKSKGSRDGFSRLMPLLLAALLCLAPGHRCDAFSAGFRPSVGRPSSSNGRRNNQFSSITHRGESTRSEELLSRLHCSARKAIKKGALQSARSMYGHALYDWRGPTLAEKAIAKTYLLLALVEKRLQNFDGCEEIFLEGIQTLPPAQTGQLFQAYALLESGRGRMEHAYQLAQKAVEMDPSLAPILKWRMFREVQVNAADRNQGSC